MGLREKSLSKQVYKDSGKLPERVQNAPRLLPGLELFLRAFYDLDRERDIGYHGRTVLKQRDVISYAELSGFEAEQTARLRRLIPKMDDAFLKRLEERKPAKS